MNWHMEREKCFVTVIFENQREFVGTKKQNIGFKRNFMRAR